ncbi:hypothetical protein B0H13DRAFT_2302367 [Mycena leptocephala]|nr:hypothetical protein B0H13DRAFT_2302367 [Mycena leptocephala]
MRVPSPAYSTSSLPFTQHHPRLLAPRPRQLAFVLHRDSSSFSLFSAPHHLLSFSLYPRLRRFPQSAPLPTNACPLHIADHAALRDNVLFGRPFEEERRYRRGRIIEHSCLLPDLRSRADGDLTERPKVIDLSASEYRPRRVLQCGRRRNEDPLSAVDANVGKALFCTAIPSLVSFYQMFLRIGSNVNFVDFFAVQVSKNSHYYRCSYQRYHMIFADGTTVLHGVFLVC